MNNSLKNFFIGLLGVVIVAALVFIFEYGYRYKNDGFSFLTKIDSSDENNDDNEKNNNVKNNNASQGKDKLDIAIGKAIIEDNRANYLDGECEGEGHIVLQTGEENGKYVVYTYSSYGEYGFENDTFVKVSGSGAIPVKITFRKENDDYIYEKIDVPEDGSHCTPSIKRIFPRKLWNKVLSHDNKVYEECSAQEREYAKEYLISIGREAEVKERVEHELPDMNVNASNSLLDMYGEYPYYIGTLEKVEDGVRYVYEKKWEPSTNGDGTVSFIKSEYDTKNVIEEAIIEIKDGKMTYKKGNERTLDYSKFN